MINDAVVFLSPETVGDGTARCAISVAEAFGAHVLAVAVAYEPVVVGSIMDGFPADLINAQRRENEKAAKAAIDRFEQLARAAGISAESRLLSAAVSDAADLFAHIARRFDLAIVTQDEPGKPGAQDLIVAAALFKSGRPVIVVPYVHKNGLKLDRVMVCWDGSATAARAIADAMPLLERAKNIDVVIVATEQAKSDEVTGADIGQHLARHGLKVDVRRVQAADIDVASAILSYAADNAVDFIVMGAYGHSRLREFILGGATRGMLKSMTVPTLMSH
jgi:nucleotide-binding universal stress UspA family protein